jgi:hypothetical protein
MGMRRMTRLTNAFSKKWENLEAAYSLWFAFYKFCRVHGTQGNARNGGGNMPFTVDYRGTSVENLAKLIYSN